MAYSDLSLERFTKDARFGDIKKLILRLYMVPNKCELTTKFRLGRLDMKGRPNDERR